MAAWATSDQRRFIRSLMRKQELPLDFVSVLHRDVFTRADIPWRDFAQVDAALSLITQKQASDLIAALQARGI